MKKIDFLKYRYLFLIISVIIIVSGLIYGFTTGFAFDVDFKGGTNIQVDLKEPFDNNDVSKVVEEQIGSKPTIQKVGTSGTTMVSITTNVISNEEADKVVAALKEKYINMDEPSTRNVQATFGKETTNSAIKAVVLSVIAILIYVAIRFRTLGLSAAITAIIAELHDVLILVAMYAFLKLPINSTFVAVVLTIIGYSINDTIIVYDRIRENKRKAVKSTELKNTINESLNQTLTRTMYTSFTTIMAILIVYIFASINNQTVLKEFSLPLVIGIISGTYSSVFIATSLWYTIENRMNKRKAAKSKVNDK